uniref:tRNA pseudouridine synthase Pus10 n=1 Tax=Candidatus Methanophaga sp. ANME-1 ERB7 TaxID=2759913 RepID=A0A7G9ZB99_9EURY|nr:tRNA pseudouridine synthase Pus10 [Methanosarcinales archaeon ANME-1 ERB7]
MNNQIPPQLSFRTEALENAEIIAAARTIINEGPICDNCLGRQFAKISSGLTNEKRGEILRSVLRAELKEGKCWLCNGLFENFDALVVKALETLKGYEFDSFLVGTKVSGMLLENEELLWEIAGAAHAEPLKAELNREVGKRIEHETGKIADFDRPDLVVILNLVTEAVELQINSVFIYGRYRKFKRGIPQTKWLCRECRGKGCGRCDFTGKMYAESVEELIGGSIVEEFGGLVTVLHGSGREDIDARMLGSGRPFVMEIKEPRLRELDLKWLENKVNDENKDKVEVLELQYVKREAVAKIKNAKVDKTYRAVVSLKTSVLEEDLRSALDNLIGAVIEQRTPLRVVHRRADLVRKRKVYDARLVSFEVPIVELKCDGGLYIKELISGDNGRTIPSLSELLGTEAEVIELDVVDVAI